MYWFPAHFVLAMFVAGLNSKTLGINIVYALALLTFYPDNTALAMLDIFYIPAVLLASFRD